jgi:hypothetical protein
VLMGFEKRSREGKELRGKLRKKARAEMSR